MKTKIRYHQEDECFFDTLMYVCPKCKQKSEVAMLIGDRTRDNSYYEEHIKQMEKMYIHLRRKYDILVKAIRIVKKENKSGN